MASLENRSGHYHVVFRFGGKKFTRSLETDNEREADRLRTNLEQTIRDVKSGRMVIPDDADIATFLLSDGKLTDQVVIETVEERREEVALTLRALFTSFTDKLPEGALEENTLDTMSTHRDHLIRILGAEIFVESIDLNSIDKYVKQRSKESGIRGRKVSSTTMRKELVTLLRVWNWGQKRKLIGTDFPDLSDVEFPKTEEKPPFQTYDEIVAQIDQDDLSNAEQLELWDALYLRVSEVDQVMKQVRENAYHSFLYPMVVTAAHTGARRSELIRSRLSDIRKDSIIIREKKKKQGRLTTRRVPLTTKLKETLGEWCEQHPGGPFTFITVDEDRNRATDTPPLSRDIAHKSFQSVLKGSRWEVLRGWHCLRHSFISNLASKGIDQRLIDEFVGHQSEEMRRRYRHLFPDVKEAAIQSVFG